LRQPLYPEFNAWTLVTNKASNGDTKTALIPINSARHRTLIVPLRSFGCASVAVSVIKDKAQVVQQNQRRRLSR
jgi:hypothetical protein